MQTIPLIDIYRICNQYLSNNLYKETSYSQFLWICKKEKLLAQDLYEQLTSYEKNFLEKRNNENKTTFFTEKNQNESISPKHLANNIEIFTFSKANHLSSQNEIKLISSQNSSPLFQPRQMMDKEPVSSENIDEEREYHTENNNIRTEEDFVSQSSYSQNIMNSLSPPSFDKSNLRKQINSSSYCEKK